MLNEEKIRWMTKASIYEKRQGRIDLGRNEYFMGDYVRLHLLKNGISLTIAYILLAGLYAVYKIEEIFVCSQYAVGIAAERNAASLYYSACYLYGNWYCLLFVASISQAASR